MTVYKTRKHQLRAFLREIVADCPEHEFPRAVRRRIAKGLRDAAMVGACEERSRTLEILQSPLSEDPQQVRQMIAESSVRSVLGFDD